MLEKEAPCRMEKGRTDLPDDFKRLQARVVELEDQLRRLELKKAIRKGTVELLGKDPSVETEMLTNKGKDLLV